MNEHTSTAIILASIALSMAIGAGINAMAGASVAVEAAKAGLQQCPTTSGLAWQKECTK